MIIPYKVDVLTDRSPIANFFIMTCLVLAFGAALNCSAQQIRPFILRGWSAAELAGHMWLHASLPHIIGNLLFLWVFGNAVCSKVGNAFYVLIYIGAGISAAVAHVAFNGDPAVGASGALYGVIGAYLVLYPFNSIRCILIFIYVRRFNIAGLWIIFWWIILNVLGAVTGYTGGTAYFAHLGGLLAGATFAIILVKAKLVVRDNTDQAIFRSLNP